MKLLESLKDLEKKGYKTVVTFNDNIRKEINIADYINNLTSNILKDKSVIIDHSPEEIGIYVMNGKYSLNSPYLYVFR